MKGEMTTEQKMNLGEALLPTIDYVPDEDEEEIVEAILGVCVGIGKENIQSFERMVGEFVAECWHIGDECVRVTLRFPIRAFELALPEDYCDVAEFLAWMQVRKEVAEWNKTVRRNRKHDRRRAGEDLPDSDEENENDN